MIVGLLLLIAVILLFGAAAVKGWLKSGLVVVVLGLGLVLAAAWVKKSYDAAEAADAHAILVAGARLQALAEVARAVGRPVRDLEDIITYAADDTSDFAVCGTIAGTQGFGGTGGRQRFLTGDGTGIEIEKRGARAAFDERAAFRCRVISYAPALD